MWLKTRYHGTVSVTCTCMSAPASDLRHFCYQGTVSVTCTCMSAPPSDLRHFCYHGTVSVTCTCMSAPPSDLRDLRYHATVSATCTCMSASHYSSWMACTLYFTIIIVNITSQTQTHHGNECTRIWKIYFFSLRNSGWRFQLCSSMRKHWHHFVRVSCTVVPGGYGFFYWWQ
jgi:hypothetical protein